MISSSPRVRNHDFERGWFLERAREMCFSAAQQERHRKAWEWCVIAQAYIDAGCPEKAIGFGVGREAIPSWLVARGAKYVLASDWRDEESKWADGQNASALEHLHWPEILPEEPFLCHACFEEIDMNAIPDSLKVGEFGFSWSSGSMEHIGGIDAALEFFCEQMKCLAPGGIAAHTTELLRDERDDGLTIDENDLCILRRSDLSYLQDRLAKQGDLLLPLDLAPGIDPYDQFVDAPPYEHPHLNIQLEHCGEEFVSTSLLLVARRGGGA